MQVSSNNSKRSKPKDDAESLWKWKGIDRLNLKWEGKKKKNEIKDKEDSKRSLIAEYLARNQRQAEEDTILGPGYGVGIGCGAGIGLALVGGAAYGGGGSSPWNHMNLAFGVGIGCGVGLGFGYGQGIGGGFSFDSLNSYLWSL